MIRDSICASRYNAEKANLRSKIASHLRNVLATLIENANFADLELRSKDGLCLPAHSCILRCRAPEFFSCNVGVNFEREKGSGCFNKTIVNVSTMDSDCLTKFVQYVYGNSEDAEAAVVSESETVDLINEEALIGSSESRQSARTYICESTSTNLASWDDAFGEVNKSGNSFEIISQFKPSECLSSENPGHLEDCVPGSLESKESVDDEIYPAAVSAVSQEETFLSADGHLDKQEKTETSDSPLVETPKGASLFPLFYTMDFSPSGNNQICNTEVLHASLPRSKSSRSTTKSGSLTVDSALAKHTSLHNFGTLESAKPFSTDQFPTSKPLYTPCSRLGVDLLSMFCKGQDSDCMVLAKTSQFKAHK